MSTPSAAPPVSVVPFVQALAEHGDRAALIGRDGAGTRWVLSYAELAARAGEVADRLGGTRRLVLVEGDDDLGAVTAYLGVLAAGHVALLAPGGAAGAALVAAYDPDVVLRGEGGRWLAEERREGSAHELHPDLALLLSTSGSTGSPKLVRLSQDNLQANAEAIATYLGISAADRAVTTLPMHYCYGLSVLHSHLLRGAALVLTGLSVVDRCFWELFRAERCTSFAGVPYTFDLLDRAGFAEMDLPHLRYVTQAGGRLDPQRVRSYAQLGRRRGWDLFVMYGQTEATARMAYLPPDLAVEHPEAIGVPVPGGSIRLEPLPEPVPLRHGGDRGPGGAAEAGEIGEIVYSGPNVMLGYAQSPADLALGRTVDVLRTGDVGRRRADGLFEVVGRRSRFVKVFGLRIDLQQAERLLGAAGVPLACVGVDDELVVAVGAGAATGPLLRLATRELGLPPHAVRVLQLPELPRLPSGKVDYARVAELARRPGPRPAASAGASSVAALYAQLLDRPDVGGDDTFVGLGGDSLSYVEVSVRLEELLGHLPPDWHTTPVRDLVPTSRRRWAGPVLETSVVLRAVAIVLVVSAHTHLLDVMGGAHTLLAVAGFNFARFQLAARERAQRVRGQLTAVARLVVPSVLWIAAVTLLTTQYGLVNVFLLNAVLGSERWDAGWHFWFLEVLTYVLLGVTALLAVPWVHRVERRFPFALPCALFGVGLLTRFGLVDPGVPNTMPVFWLFTLGWAVARAGTPARRLLVTVMTLATVPGFFSHPEREAVIAVGILLLTWVPAMPCPRVLRRVAGVLASSSLYVYVTHWQVMPHLWHLPPWVIVLASLAVGIGYWLLVGAVWRRLPALRRGAARVVRRDGARVPA